MKQGERSKQRQLGDGKGTFRETLERHEMLPQSSESSDCTTATEVDFKQICFGLVQEETLKCD